MMGSCKPEIDINDVFFLAYFFCIYSVFVVHGKSNMKQRFGKMESILVFFYIWFGG